MSAPMPRKSASASASASSTLKSNSSAAPKCNVCMKKDGWRKNVLKKCRSCNLHVHNACYGLSPSQATLTSFECWACQAVGKALPGRHLLAIDRKRRRLPGLTEDITQTTRPSECALCSVTDGHHAIHPLYDAPGKKGRQMILPENKTRPIRLAWVHTICAFGISSHRATGGCVYACDKNGNYDCWDHDGEIDPEDAQDDVTTLPEGRLSGTHHFVLCGMDAVSDRNDQEDKNWADALKEHRHELKCTICGKSDKGTNVLRVPLQCCAGDDEEFEEFKKYHATLDGPCGQALHVGCAHYGLKGQIPENRQVWFYPGGEDGNEFEDPVVQIFCVAHAKDLFPNEGNRRLSNVATKTALSRRNEVILEKGILRRTLVSDAITGVPPALRQHRGSTETRIPKKKIVHAAETQKDPAHVTDRPGTIQRERSLSKADLPEPKINQQTNAVKQTVSVELTSQRSTTESHQKRRRLDTTESQGQVLSREAMSGDLSVVQQPIKQKDDVLKEMTDDVVKAVQTALDSDEDDLYESVKERRMHWKGQNLLTKTEFKKFWKEVGTSVIKRFPNISLSTGGNRSEEEAQQDVEEEEQLTVEKNLSEAEDTMDVEKAEDPWAYLWAEDAEPFDPGGWDTYEVVR